MSSHTPFILLWWSELLIVYQYSKYSKMPISSLEGKRRKTHIFDLSVFSVVKAFYSKMFLCCHFRWSLVTSGYQLLCSMKNPLYKRLSWYSFIATATSFHPLSLTPGNHSSFLYLYSFVFLRIFYKRYQTGCRFGCWLPSLHIIPLGSIQVIAYIHRLILFSAKCICNSGEI